MLAASLALVVAVGAAVVVGRAVLSRRRLVRALEDLRRGDLFRSTSYAEAERAAAWLTTVTDPITKPLTRPLAGATQSVAGSVAGMLARVRLPGGRRPAFGVLSAPAHDTLILAELGRGVDEAVLERRDLTADLADDETLSFGVRRD